MSKKALLASALLGLAIAGCEEGQPTEPRSITVPLFVQSEDSHNFGAHLKGENEVPPVDTRAQGQAEFFLSEDGTELSYRLITSRMSGITQAHIHIGDVGVNGPVVVFLFGFNAAGVENAGVLAEGTITQANLIARPAIGFGATMPELLAELRTGGAYVNVHTLVWPGGEVRGQLAENGPST